MFLLLKAVGMLYVYLCVGRKHLQEHRIYFPQEFFRVIEQLTMQLLGGVNLFSKIRKQKKEFFFLAWNIDIEKYLFIRKPPDFCKST